MTKELLSVPRLSPIPYGDGQFDSGANPDFQVTSASRNKREMDRLLKSLSARSDRLERREAALASVIEARQAASVSSDTSDVLEVFDPVAADTVVVEAKT